MDRETSERRPWRDLGKPLFPVASAIAVLGLAPLAAFSATWLYTHLSGAAKAGVMTPGTIEHRQTMQTVIYFAALQGTVLALGLLALRRWSDAGRGASWLAPPPEGIRAYVAPTLALVVGAGLWLALIWTIAPGTLAAEVGDYPRLIRSGWGVLMIPVLCLLAPAAEEVLFRGLLFGALRTTPLRPAGAAILSSLAWAGLHIDHTPFSQAHLFAAGLALCWLVQRTRTLRVAIWCHVLFNALLTLLLLATVNE